jgi:hypothetical protein
MRKTVLAAASAALSLVAGLDANAQLFRRSGPAAPPTAAPSVDCAQLAKMPNAPMSFEACRQMMNSAASMESAMKDPAGQRPGDEAMACDQIKAEIMASGGVEMNREHLARAQSAGADYQAKSAKVQREGKALAAEQAATNLAVGAASFVPGVGNVVATAAAAKNMAETQAFSAHAQATLTPAQRALTGSTAVVVGDLAANMQDNPRQARLMSLAMQKNCR